MIRRGLELGVSGNEPNNDPALLFGEQDSALGASDTSYPPHDADPGYIIPRLAKVLPKPISNIRGRFMVFMQ